MAKRWKKEQITYLKRYSTKRDIDELAKRFRTDGDTVRAKLDELGLEAADYKRVELPPDPALEPLEEGLEALYAKRWKQAEKLLTKAADEAEQPELGNRARRYLAAVHRQTAKKKAASDPYLEAVYERNRGRLDEALEICRSGGRQSKDQRFALLAASIHSLKGDLDEAARFLELAIEFDPKNRVHAYHDADFAALREEPDYAHLFAPSD